MSEKNIVGNGNAVTPEIQSENGPYCQVSVRAATAREAVAQQCARVRDAVRALLALYTRTRLLDFQLADPPTMPSQSNKAVAAHSISETMLFCIEAVHCLPMCWSHDEYLFHAQIYYGTRPLKTVMWEKRQYLVQLAGALPLVLLAATSWYGEHRAHLVRLLRRWEKPSPLNAMHLLLPCFPDLAVREFAAELINGMSDDDLIRVLPQLTQALRYETYEASPLAELLLSRALSAPAVAHKLFWLLVHSLPNVPQAPSQEFLGISLEENASECQEVDATLTATWRYRLLLRALLAVCGDNLTRTLLRQQLLVKVGDDLRQDALVLQVIKVMDTLWLKAGLDLRIVTFQALPTSNQRGSSYYPRILRLVNYTIVFFLIVFYNN
ncbi:Phosphatidylinositol-4-phosphate 3-kinase C2 domain-containing subunit alpha [Papilio machaon]|uniref:Phosphatidylinositol-4-phosphate 3-kinase C2 domain-containing subunit alpha n=1 Tax=Papilio machaon TaxID=76193 RepID=A0A0N0PE29_PAPMA|nr:Phosphatidylinositol-4-phosphate 3-kinase C2 domain-containing subunit alpha [Papilio machaon]